MLIKILIEKVGFEKIFGFAQVCPSSVTASNILLILREKWNIPESIEIKLQTQDGIPIRDMDGSIAKLVKQHPGGIRTHANVSQLTLKAVLDGPVDAISAIEFAYSDEDSEDPDLVDDVQDDDDAASDVSFPITEPSDLHGKIIGDDDNIYNPREFHPVVSAPDNLYHEESEYSISYEIEEQEDCGDCGIEWQREGTRHLCCSRCDVELAAIIFKEYPALTSGEEGELARLVSSDSIYRQVPYNINFRAKSSLPDVDDVTFARSLWIGKTFGIDIQSEEQAEKKLALYGEIFSINHSCKPNAIVHYERSKAPFSATCRCAVSCGIHKGEEVTALFRKVDSLPFLLLPKDRRQRMLRKIYHFTCDCIRCSESVANANETSLTGVFFTDSSADNDPVKQKELNEILQADFDALNLLRDDETVIVLISETNTTQESQAKRCDQLFDFITKYSNGEHSLKLHNHHWRMNLARLAYIQETVRMAISKDFLPLSEEPGVKRKAKRSSFIPKKVVFDICFKQLQVESIFIPDGHPYRLTTYEQFQYLLSLLPDSISQEVLKTAGSITQINWSALQALKKTWGLLKRINLSPELRSLIPSALKDEDAEVKKMAPPPRHTILKRKVVRKTQNK